MISIEAGKLARNAARLHYFPYNFLLYIEQSTFTFTYTNAEITVAIDTNTVLRGATTFNNTLSLFDLYDAELQIPAMLQNN